MNGSRQTTFRFLQSMQKSESEARSWRLPFLMRWAEKIKTYNFFLQKDTLEKVSIKNFVKYALTRVLAGDIM